MDSTPNTILLLGGSYAQIPAIKAAKERGLYTILCDYLPNNPGQKYADEYINASTTDKERILGIAKEQNVDYVMAYASDPAAPTAAYISEELGLPGNSYESVKTLSEKHRFRSLMEKAGLPCPRSLNFTKSMIERGEVQINLGYPLIVKPVDSSGSKGVRLINSFAEFKDAALFALSFSRNNRIIVEEYVSSKRSQLHGDGFVINNKLAFCYLGDHFYNNDVNPFVPFSTRWPSETKKADFDKVYHALSTLITHSGFKNGPINIEVRISNDNEIYIMEVGPRSGGNFVPQLLNYATGFNMVEASLNVAMGKSVTKPAIKKRAAAYYAIHSEHDGNLKRVDISPAIKPYIKEYHKYVDIGTKVKSFQGSNAALGIVLLVFPSNEIMQNIMDNMHQYITVEVD